MPNQFARYMWPDSPYWQKVYNCGPYGASRGIAMNRAAGAYIGRLRNLGLVRDAWRQNDSFQYDITEDGMQLLDQSE